MNKTEPCSAACAAQAAAPLDFYRVAAAVPPLQVANVPANTQAVLQRLRQAAQRGADVAVFPELCLTG